MEKAFIHYLQSKGFTVSTQQSYIKDVQAFLQWYASTSSAQADVMNCTKKDILHYLDYLQKEKQYSNSSKGHVLSPLNHYFKFSIQSKMLVNNPVSLLKIRGTKKRTLYYTYTPEELAQLYDNFYLLYVQNFDDSKIPQNVRLSSSLSKHRNYIMFGFLAYQGLATNELHTIKLTDIDISKASVYIAGGRQSNERKIPLHAAQIGSLMHYIHTTRPEIIQTGTADTGRLFLPLSQHGKSRNSISKLTNEVQAIATQVGALDSNFIQLRQIRASVITNWLHTEGLRKAQYLAGHKYISSTEHYLPNNMENLIDDITKFNPF